jgi:DNA processing protein
MGAARKLSDEERINWLRLTRTEQIGPITFHELLQRFGSAAAAIDALPDLSRRGGRTRQITVYARARAEDELSAAARLKAQFVAPGERGYPPFLRHVHGAPPLFCVSGNLDLADMDSGWHRGGPQCLGSGPQIHAHDRQNACRQSHPGGLRPGTRH